jgi:hypothetical protein
MPYIRKRAIKNKTDSVVLAGIHSLESGLLNPCGQTMKKSIEVNASPEAIFRAIRSYRSADPENRTVKSEADGKAIIEEKFGGVPIVGHSMITYEETEVPFERIDYTLVHGDKLSKFEGAWVLTPSSDGKSTNVDLIADLDIALVFPFKDQILNAQADQDMQRRLDYVKEMAENS